MLYETLNSRLQKLDSKIEIFDLIMESDYLRMEKLLADNPCIAIGDSYKDQLLELMEINHPEFRGNDAKYHELLQTYISNHGGEDKLWKQGRWVFYPWKNKLVHVVSPDLFYHLRTARNRNLISQAEQTILSQAKIGIAGLSVGNSVALSLAITGCGEAEMRLADADCVGLTNLNRLRAGVDALGVKKTIVASQQILELNPFAQLTIFDTGITMENVDDFLSGLDILIEEMDDLPLKIVLRQRARALGIPVISGADNGDHVTVDIERFDLEPDRPLFHGRIQELSVDEIMAMSPAQRFALINDMVGVEFVTEDMKESLLEVGKTIYTWPQLGSTVSVTGGVVACMVRKILLYHSRVSGKFDVNLERVFDEKYDSVSATYNRQKITEMFLAKQAEMFQT